MVLLAKNYKAKQIFSIKKISEKEGIPFDFLEKILSELEKSKLVKGKKGILGGYILAKNPKKITTKDIVSALESTTLVDCSFCKKTRKCLSQNVWKKIDSAVSKTLKQIKLSDLIK